MPDITSPMCYTILIEHASRYIGIISPMIPLSCFQLTLVVRQLAAASLICISTTIYHRPESQEIFYVLSYCQPYSFYLLLIFYKQWFGLCVEDQG